MAVRKEASLLTGRPLARLLVPITLIAVGVVLLLNTLGILDWSIWNRIWPLWPVLVVLAGVRLLWRNTRYG